MLSSTEKNQYLRIIFQDPTHQLCSMNRIIFCALALLLINTAASATHLRGGHISIKQLGKTSLTCRITITVYTNTDGTSVLFGGTKFDEGDWLNFGDGTIPKLVPEVGPGKTPPGSTYTVIDFERSLSRATYIIDHTYAAPGTYVVNYREPNRNEGILNLVNSVNTIFYLKSSFTLDITSDNAYTSPDFLTEPIFYASAGNELTYSMAAKDSSDYSLRYELVNPIIDISDDLSIYELPESITINPFNGLITWDTKFKDQYSIGEYLFTVKIYQLKDDQLIGYTIRDFPILLEDNSSTGTIADNRDLDVNNRIYIPSENNTTFKVFAEDSGLTSLEAFSELSSLSNSFSFSSYDSTQGEKKIKVGVISITSSAELLRDNPYPIVIRGFYQLGKYSKDLGYLFYTKDVELPGLDIILGVGEEELALHVYPNPTKDFLKIESDGPKSKTIKLLSTNGQLILEKKNFKEDSLDLQGVPPGVYILLIGSRESSQKVFRILKTN